MTEKIAAEPSSCSATVAASMRSAEKAALSGVGDALPPVSTADARDHAEARQSVEIFRHLLDRHRADRRGQCVADLADAAMPIDQVERLIAERR
jgi:hypothetical protein